MRFMKLPSALMLWLLFLFNGARADRFINTGSGTINSCSDQSRTGLGVVSPENIPGETNLVLGAVDQFEEAVEGGQIQLNAPNNVDGKTAFLDNYVADVETPLLRFLAGNNAGSDSWLASLHLLTGDFGIVGEMNASAYKVGSTYLNVPDYVFDPGYPLRNLRETENFIRANRHLPDIPSADEFRKNGMDLGGMNLKLLKKVEELTLYAIEQEYRIQKLEELMLRKGDSQ